MFKKILMIFLIFFSFNTHAESFPISISDEKSFKSLNIDPESFLDYFQNAQELTDVLALFLEKKILVEFSITVYNSKNPACIKKRDCTEMDINFNLDGLISQLNNSQLSTEQMKQIIFAYTQEIIKLDLKVNNYRSKAKTDIIFRLTSKNSENDSNHV